MREGWREFKRQTWISQTFLFFLLGNFFGSSWGVLGPYVMKQHYNGALSWGFIGGATGVGAIVGGVLALRLKPRRIVFASCLWALPYGAPTLALGLLLPLPLIVAVAFISGLGLALHLTLWFTAFQQQVPENARSRVSSYDALGVDVTGLDCLDVGASTGGFTDVLLQRGAARVIALDVGYGQLHSKIRDDPRVTVIERVNARSITELEFAPQLITCDVSFISVKLALPPALRLASPGWQAFVLVKPQFEAGRAEAPKGIVRDPAVRRRVVREVAEALLAAGGEAPR